jgi:RNA polymerase sigma-70 factor (ECF subfamily)
MPNVCLRNRQNTGLNQQSNDEQNSTMSSQALNPLSLTLPQEETAPAEHTTPFDDIDAVVATHQQRIFRFILVATRDADAAHTITQDTFLRAWSARASFRNECAVSTWLMRIAMNLLRDHTRTERFRFWKRAAATSVDIADPAVHLTQPGSSIESRLIASEQMALVWDTVAQLSARQRSIFILRFVDEMELADIAVATGLPVPTVKSHLYRALNNIRSRHNSANKDSL